MNLHHLKSYNFMCCRCKMAQPMTAGRKKSAQGWICLPCTKGGTPRPAAVCADPADAVGAFPHSVGQDTQA